MSENSKTLDVIFFGNRAVGKTSLLASMYMQMENDELTTFSTASGKEMKFSTKDTYLFNTLKNKWFELQKQIKSGEFGTPPVLPYEGTINIEDTPFCFKTQRRECQLNFVDTPGTKTDEINEELIKRLNHSLMAICVVDAAILMEQDTETNKMLNAPLSIKKLLESVLDDGDSKQPMTCLFVMTKCEKWMNTKEDQNALANRFEEIFKPVLNYATSKKFPLYYLPVQTMGCVEFSHIDPITQEMVFKTVSNKFEPKDVIFPLALVLKSLLRKYDEQQKTSWWITILSWLFPWKEDFSEYKSVLEKKFDEPIDYRGNNNGKSPTLTKTSFWN